VKKRVKKLMLLFFVTIMLTCSIANDMPVSAAPIIEIAPPQTGAATGEGFEGRMTLNPTQLFNKKYEAIMPSDADLNNARKQYKNKDILGWLTVPGTDIDAPVARGKGLEYENMTIDGKIVKASAKQETALFFSPETRLDCDLEYIQIVPDTYSATGQKSKNIIVYGHNWTNVKAPFRIGKNDIDSGFAELQSYTDLDFLTANQHIFLYEMGAEFDDRRNDSIIPYRVVCVMYTDISNTLYYQPYYDFISPEWFERKPDNYTDYIEGLKKWSMFKSETLENLDKSDELLTLSTCTRGIGSQASQRFVVVAMRMIGEDYERVEKYTPAK
jgi:hypothetical protein